MPSRNIGGSLPSFVFAEVLDLPTLWVPQSHPGCQQHAPNEHLLKSVAREGLQIAAGLFFDLAATATPVRSPRPGTAVPAGSAA